MTSSIRYFVEAGRARAATRLTIRRRTPPSMIHRRGYTSAQTSGHTLASLGLFFVLFAEESTKIGFPPDCALVAFAVTGLVAMIQTLPVNSGSRDSTCFKSHAQSKDGIDRSNGRNVRSMFTLRSPFVGSTRLYKNYKYKDCHISV